MSERERAWAKAAAWIIGAEGGYVNDPDDPGGETKFGISKRAYPTLDIAGLTEADALEIYRRDYWERNRCDVLAEAVPGLALAHFDASVNSGGAAAAKLLCRALGVTPEVEWTSSGVLVSLGHRLAAGAAPDALVETLLLERAFYVASLRNAPKYIRGWMNRIKALREAARLMKEI